MTRTEILNTLIKRFNYKTYLEVGVSDPSKNFDLIECRMKISVDPNGRACFTGTSDEFFAENKLNFDLVFIDGLHEEQQVTKDIDNALNCINDNGTVVLHDCLPLSEEQQSETHNGSVWVGTVWRSLAKIRMTRTDLQLNVVNTDWGCGILRRGASEIFPVTPDTKLDYGFLLQNADAMFNIISVDQFHSKYG